MTQFKAVKTFEHEPENKKIVKKHEGGALNENVTLSGFNMPEGEALKGIVGKYAEKIGYLTNYRELKLEMKERQKERIKYGIKALLIFDGGKAISEEEGANPLVLVDEVMRKLLAEVEHRVRKS